MPSAARGSRLHFAVAVAAAVMVVGLAGLVVPYGEVRCSAVVDAARSFTLQSIAPGSYQWSLRDGSAAGGQALIRQRTLQYERSDLVEMRLAPELSTGMRVAAGQPVATVSSLHTQRRLSELRSQRAALAAQRALLVAGGPPEVVEAALRGVDLAEAQRASGQAELARTRVLAAKGLASAGELEIAELQDEVDRLAVALAQARVGVARGPVRPESLAELDARLAAVDAGIDELGRLAEEEQVLCPIDGLAEVGGVGAELRVHQLDMVYLDILIPVDARSRVQVEAEVLFATSAVPRTTFRGVLVELAGSAAPGQGRPVFWASARIDNPGHRLRCGMIGTAYLPDGGKSLGSLAAFRRRLLTEWIP